MAVSDDYVLRVRARSSLVRTGLLSYVLLSLPLFGALYFLGASRGTWPVALLVHAVTLAGAGAAYYMYRRTFIGVTATEVHERGIYGGIRAVPLSRVSNTILVSTYRNASTDTTEQLLIVDADTRRLVRMRGAFWTTAAMRAVAAATGVPLTEAPDPVTAKVFFEQYPGSAYWFENRPALTSLTVILSLVAMLALVLGLMALMGIPIENSL